MNKLFRTLIAILLLITGSFSLYFCANSEINHHTNVAPSKINNKPEAARLVKNSNAVKENAGSQKATIATTANNYRPNLIIPGRKMQSAVFEPGIQRTIGLDGATLTLPAGALKQTNNLSVTGLMTEDLPPIPGEITNVTKNYPGYRFLPHGMLFASVAIISMAYDESLIPEGFTKDDIYTYYFDEKENKWKALERDSIDSKSNLVVSNTLHFTDMINGIIKVPESPQTAGYAPTSIKDIKAADPTAGITLIAPPSANNDGSADISFPFKLPGGRAGMQPQLGLQYSSSGWTGYGWSLSTPGISVDASWGVPHYDAGKESETYSMGSSQLTPVAHRSEYVARTAEKRFYPRIEGGFSKIIRHGDKPGNYWWEVTGKNGMHSFYGGTPETGVLPEAVLSDANGNIGFWALTQMRDVHDNFVSYSYDKLTDKGQQLYPHEIAYTGHASEQGAYKITFLRDDSTNTYQRKDIRIDARLGFVERDDALLRRVNMAYGTDIIRSYTLQYKDGAFLKTMLESVSEVDADGKVFYSHTFDYYDDVQSTKGYVPFAPEKTWNSQDDNLKKSLLSPLNVFFKDVTALGGSSSSGSSGGLALTVGLYDGNLFTKSTTAGGNISFQGSSGEGFLTMADMNGDGLPDKVYKQGYNIYYRPNMIAPDGTTMFGEARLVKGINSFSATKTTGFGFGFEANPPFSSLGYNHHKSKTKTNIYFSDFNADGLIDLAANGVVYFNHIDQNGDPVFSVSSGETPNPIYATSTIDKSILPDPVKEQEELAAQFPLHDAVRMWMAPYSGIVNINAPVQLIEDTSTVARAYTLKDGVKVSIQLTDKVLWSTDIAANDYTIKTPGVGSLSISKGDRVYFRVQSQSDGSYDLVKWDPEINYTYINGNDTLYKWVDTNNKKIAHYKASEDFILAGNQSVGMPKTGIVRLKSAFSKPVTSDSVKLDIVKTDSAGHVQIIYTRDYSWNQQPTNDSVNMNIPVIMNDNILFRVSASTGIDWSTIKWKPYIEYTQMNDTTPVKDSDGKPTLSFQVVPYYTVIFNNPLAHARSIVADSSFMISLGLDSVDNFTHPLKITPDILSGSLPWTVRDTFVLSVKDKNKLYGKKTFHLQGRAIIPADTLTIDVKLGDSLYFEYYFKQVDQANTITQSYVKLKTTPLDSMAASLYTMNDPVKYEVFSPLYRGWSQFDYDGNGARATAPIDQDLLALTNKRNGGVKTANDTADLNGMQNPMSDVFTIMVPYSTKGCFLGTDQQVYVSPGEMSSSRRGEKSIIVEPYEFPSSGLSSVPKISTDISQSATLGAGVGPVKGSASHSWGESNIVSDMMDMNGDRFPDLLTTDHIQYTGVRGNLSGSSIPHGLGDHHSKSDANGVTLGGGAVVAKSSNSMSPLPTKESKVSVALGDNFQSSTNTDGAEETSKSSIGITGNFSTNKDYTNSTWMDINGDGLPDKVYKDGTIRLNLGYSFAPAEKWNFDAIRAGTSLDYGGGLGVNICNGSITAGVSISKTTNEADEAFMDVNGDGLPDLVKGNTVMLNTGAGFAAPINWDGIGALDAGESIGQSANAGFTIGITFFIIPIKICINPSGSVSKGVNYANTQLSDIDGDGMPDFLTSDKEGELKVKQSTIGRTNKLKTVYRPLGSNFTLDYKRTPASYNNPGGQWALASIKSFDGLKGDGVDSSMVTFEYADGQFNRHEHQFYGFSSVKSHFHDSGNGDKIYRTIEQQYSNQSYYTKGMVLNETLTDGNGNKQTGSENTYALRDIRTGDLLPESYSQNDSVPAFVSLEETQQMVYEGAPTSLITTRVTYSYDVFGNITGYTDYSTGNEKDKVSVAIQYHSNTDKYLHATPSLQTVTTVDGLMRKRETAINSFGDITNITQLISDNQTAQYDLEYDDYGNLTKITHPANYQGERMWYAYEYDSVVHAFVKKVTDAYGYSSSTAYDYKWGVPTQTSDMNNEKMRYNFDNRGRMQTVTGPHEIASGKPYTIAFDYYPEAEVPYARTRHYDSIYNADIETYTFADGLGRPVQVKKTAMLFSNAGTDDTQGLVVSGKVIYDGFGRAVESYQPVFEPLANATTYNATPDIIKPTVTAYDVLDRTLSVTLPDGAVTTQRYGIGAYHGEVVHIDTLTDALGHKAINYTSAKGQKRASVLTASSGDITTSFTYNAINELMAVTDPKGNQTQSVYDKAGRRVSVNQPDGGLTEFAYDAAGNLTSKITANLRKQIPNGGAITYKYDRERLTEIVYPKNTQNKVQYNYGAPGAAYHRAGRITLVQDASGGQEFFYGTLGEVEKTIRTVQLGDADMRTWIWSASYDTWNRVQTMTYPDGEKVTYGYNRAGNLQKMDGKKLGRTYAYISKIGYDKYEKQVYLQYGNGSVTTYNYEPERQRLAQMSVTSNSKQLMDNTYKYDALNNIMGIANSAVATGDIGGSTAHTYTYDDLNRLIGASGVFNGSKDSSNYTLSMQYDMMGNILRKNQTHNKNKEKQTATTYDLTYKYDGIKPNAASQIGERNFTYDENGNLTDWEDIVTNDFRQLAWDEENRLTLISDNGYINHYVYDAGGERVIKSHGGSQGVYINGAPAGIVNHTDNNYTVYVSPYFVLQNNKFTKHYYAGSSRVTSKIGNGQFENQYRPGVFEITSGSVNYINRQQQIAASKKAYIEQAGIAPGPPTMKGIYAEPEYTGTALPDDSLTTAVPAGWPQKPVFAPAGGPPGAPIQWGDKITNSTVEAGFGYVGNGNVEELLRYFYHSDHLGSTSYITDAQGNVTQYIAYMPFGESFIEQHSDWDSPYKFNGKELDTETGLYYYGARYLNPRTSAWLSVDPLAAKYPFASPYAYCLNNPIKLIDADGREPIKPQAGTAAGFVAFLNNTRSKMGTLTGSMAHDAMMRLGKTEMNWKHFRPEPMTTNPFNTSKDKYVYTEKGGWLDMAHFMFYAGKAYEYNQEKLSAQKIVNSEGFSSLPPEAQMAFQQKAGMSPVGEAVQDGYAQEMSDRFVAKHSAYSYEDLPSDKLGAEFGANYFDSNSKLTLGEQLQNYLNGLGATQPENAPNYNSLPTTDPKDKPTRTNHTTTPIYTGQNP